MKINENDMLVGNHVTLVPYRREHVPMYHEWMLDPELQAQTASEPLTLEQEYKMQQSWQIDKDKLTFIVLDTTGAEGPRVPVGDVNLFFNDHETPQQGEIEVMIARRTSRRKGLATEAMGLLMAYAVKKLNVSSFCAKIKTWNAPSLALFRKLGFVIVKEVSVFDEVHMLFNPSLSPLQWKELVAVPVHVRSV